MATTSSTRPRGHSLVRLVIVLLGCTHGLACAHKTLIRSEPPGATILVDGKSVGEAPVWIERPMGTSGALQIRAQLKSFEPLTLEVQPESWFLWPALLATTPFWFLPTLAVPGVGPIVCGTWALATSPTLCALGFLRRYPEDVILRLRPKINTLDGLVQPTDAWTVPIEYLPNPVPPPPAEETRTPPAAPAPSPTKPDGTSSPARPSQKSLHAW